MNSVIQLGVLLFAFALLVTTHVLIVVGLLKHPPRTRALAAFFIVPLAPYWAWRERMRVRAGVWVVAAILYAVSFGLTL